MVKETRLSLGVNTLGWAVSRRAVLGESQLGIRFNERIRQRRRVRTRN